MKLSAIAVLATLGLVSASPVSEIVLQENSFIGFPTKDVKCPDRQLPHCTHKTLNGTYLEPRS